MIKILPVILFLIIILLLFSCFGVDKVANKSQCIGKENKDVELRWGYRIKSKNEYFGYTLISNGDVYKQNKFRMSKKLSHIKPIYYCSLYKKVMAEFLLTQTLNVPADTTVYIEYVHPSKGVRLKAYWNPKFKAVGSKVFREIWNELDETLPDENSELYEMRMTF